MGEATEKIDAKEQYHLLDATRYIINHLNREKPKGGGYKGCVAVPDCKTFDDGRASLFFQM